MTPSRELQRPDDAAIQARLYEIERALPGAIEYDPEHGAFCWLPRPRSYFPTSRAWNAWNARYAGRPAGSAHKHGVSIKLFSKTLRAHRVAWFLFYGEWPEVVDHIDGNPLNNRIVNLRSVTQQENMANQKRRKNNTSGVMGVVWELETGKWRATIFVRGKRRYLGKYETKGEAINARKAGELAFGFHENHGREAVRLAEQSLKFDPNHVYRRQMVREYVELTNPESNHVTDRA